MSFEKGFGGSSSLERKGGISLESREPEGFPDVDKALQLAEKKVFRFATKPEEFARPHGPYEVESIQRDLQYAEKMEKVFQRENLENAPVGLRSRYELLKKLGHVFEAIILFNGDNNEWFGGNAQMIVPSRYDDIMNGVDGIVEFEGEKNFFAHLALGIDMTMSQNSIGEKFKRIYNQIDAGELTLVRYFQSDRQHIKGEKRNMPRVVIGADKKTLADLMVIWNNEKNREFGGHSMQIQMLDEIAWQLEHFGNYAEGKGKSALAKIYRTDLDFIRNIIASKEEILGEQKIRIMRREASEDVVYQTIRHFTQSVK